jgi:hypothetical protein
MRRLALIMLIASQPLAGTAARAVPAPPSPAPAVNPDITVTGDDRLVCRRITRTATRMRTGRICRTMAQWRRETGDAHAANDPNATIDGAADTLEMIGEKISTGCGEGSRGPP